MTDFNNIFDLSSDLLKPAPAVAPIKETTAIIDGDLGFEPDQIFYDNIKKIENCQGNLFVTGDAGSGKSSLLKHYVKTTKSRVVVLAPTGVAAVNVGGQTIHSFFRFPGKPLHRENIPLVFGDSLAIYKSLDVIIIDEISMVRPDLLDAVDQFLRMNLKSNETFAGKKIIMFGDLNQLPPVVATDEERIMMNTRYGSRYFFDAHCMKAVGLSCLYLDKVHRQKDSGFLDLLNKLKYGELTDSDFSLLNSRVGKIDNSVDSITLCTTNRIADSINQSMLNVMIGPTRSYAGTMSGDVKVKNLRVDEVINLRIGAKIMTLLNNSEGKYQNGSFFNVVGLTDDKIFVENNKGVKAEIERYEFNTYKYKYNPDTDILESKTEGGFKQFPVKLAWASSVHKCVEENQLVNTTKGLIRIKYIEIGDEVLTHKGVYQKVINKFDQGIKDCFKIRTKTGLELICTGDHRLHDGEDWKMLSEYQIGDKILNVFNRIISSGPSTFRNDIVESVEHVGLNQTYDIEVENDNSFVAQGLACHNCQGQTLDKMNFDIGTGAFDHGQLYVAISRCTSLEGIILSRPIQKSDMIFEPKVKIFLEDIKSKSL